VLVDRLPGSSATVEAQLGDPEYAAWVAGQPERSGPVPPRLSDWTPDVARLTDIYDRLGELVAAVIAASSKDGKFRPPPPSPRPVTEVDRLKARARRSRHLALVDEVKAAQARYESRSSAPTNSTGG
jgi:hypothetical protein